MFVFNETISFPDHSFLHFSSPFDEDPSFLLQQQQPQNDNLLHHLPVNEPIPSTFVSNLGSESRKIGVTNDHDQIQISKRGSCKRDRHSKINTLRGPRDRRMRLSLPVAKEFFGLQDMLGFDKASKTVEWLLYQARHAIKKLSRDQQSFNDGTGDTRSPSSLVSDGEVVSGIDETTTVVNCGMKEDRKVTRKEKRGRVARKTAFHPMARECREKARARARARTREKQLQVLQNPIEQIEGTTRSTPKLQDLSKISSSWSTQMENTNGEQLSRTRNQGIIDDDQENDHDCLMIMGRWSPSNSIYNSLQNNNGSPQEHPFGDLQFFGKPWEPYNNHGIC